MLECTPGLFLHEKNECHSLSDIVSLPLIRSTIFSFCYVLKLHVLPGRLFAYLHGLSKLFQACQKIIKKLVTVLTIFFFVCLLQFFGLDWNVNLFLGRHCTWRGLSKGGNMQCSKWQWHKHIKKDKTRAVRKKMAESFCFGISYE